MNYQQFKKLQPLLFMDIETASGHTSLDADSLAVLPKYQADLKRLWERKQAPLKNDEGLTPEQMYVSRAALFPEFGKIICISFGNFVEDPSSVAPDIKARLNIKSLSVNSAGSEKDLITRAFAYINAMGKPLVAHNGKEFDFPYLCKRGVINELELPSLLDISGKKPWEVLHKDTLEMWRFGDLRAYVSLESLCLALGVDSPKEDLSGDKVSQYYHSGGDMTKVVEYCEGDVVAVAECYKKMIGIYE